MVYGPGFGFGPAYLQQAGQAGAPYVSRGTGVEPAGATIRSMPGDPAADPALGPYASVPNTPFGITQALTPGLFSFGGGGPGAIGEAGGMQPPGAGGFSGADFMGVLGGALSRMGRSDRPVSIGAALADAVTNFRNEKAAQRVNALREQEYQMRVGKVQREIQQREAQRAALAPALGLGPIPVRGGGMQEANAMDSNPLGLPEGALKAARLAYRAGDYSKAYEVIQGSLMPAEGEDTTAQRDYEYAQRQGYKGSFLDFKREFGRAPTTTVNVGAQGPDYGDPPKGTVWARNADGSVMLQQDEATGAMAPVAIPVPGGPVAREEEAAAAAAEAKERIEGVTRTVVEGDIDKSIAAITDARFPVTGLWGSLAGHVPGSPAYDLGQTLQTVKANVGFDKLQKMREASPTGGALGQVSEGERAALEATLGSLDQAQSKEQLLANLRRLRGIVTNIVHGTPEERAAIRAEGGEKAPAGGGFTVRRVR